MAEHQLILDELQSLRSRLPAAIVDELADGLRETFEYQLALHHEADTAARATLEEFGNADTITAAYFRHSPWRRAAIALVATGPLVGGLWGLTLIHSEVWAWPIPWLARAGYGVALVAVALCLVLTIFARQQYTRARLATVGGAVGLVTLDALMLTTIAAIAIPLAWPLPLAVAASLVRVTATIRMTLALITAS